MAKDCNENGRKRHNVSMSDEARKQAEQMAEEDIRNFSNFLEWLIDQEHKRRQAARLSRRGGNGEVRGLPVDKAA